MLQPSLEFLEIVPAKHLLPAWMAGLTRRGVPETFSGDELQFIGMPVGGLFCGTVYIGGDGRLWLWDIFNEVKEGIVPNTVLVVGQQVHSRDGSAYVAPPVADKHRVLKQGFDLKVLAGGTSIQRSLDVHGFQSVSFTGQYPRATLVYSDPACPIQVELEAFSPFIPLNSADSSLPATIFSFTLHNTSATACEVELSGFLENAVLKNSLTVAATRKQAVESQRGMTVWQGWAQVNEPEKATEIANLPDFGSMSLALLGAPAQIQEDGGLAPSPIGRVGRHLTLSVQQKATVNFVLTWYFPNVNNVLEGRKRHYSARFENASAVAGYVADNFDYLAEQTRLWCQTWNDSTLPHWFLNRTFANTSTLVTTTCHRFDDGRFWAWEGVGCCPGTCTHVWHYAQAMGRLFPEVERDHRERVDFGLALEENTGIIRYRAEDGATYAVDGQAGRILGAYREHQMSVDDGFLRRLWPHIKLALQKLMATDGDGDGLMVGPLHNTLDADWYGVVPWLCSLYHAALRAGEEMAREVGDSAFQQQCHAILEVAPAKLDTLCWNEDYGYYVHVGDKDHPNEVGAYNGCHIDQVMGQSWAWQVGFGPELTRPRIRLALQSLWNYNFVPDVGPFREVKTAGRWYATAGDAGLIMVSYPFQTERKAVGQGAWSAMYFNECMSGFEHQAASHMVWEGLLSEGLAITKAIHDRYHPQLRNPYNEIECSDHYARAMASYGTFLAACGFGYHGPKGELSFAPRISPQQFRAAFVCAEGWGSFEQNVNEGGCEVSVSLKVGKLRLKMLSLQPPVEKIDKVSIALAGHPVVAEDKRTNGQMVLRFKDEIEIQAGQTLAISCR